MVSDTQTGLDGLVELLRTADPRTADVDELVRRLWLATVGVPIRAPVFEPGFMLFRGRICETASTVPDLSYPPAALTRIGRLNRAGDPVFYSSTSRAAVFYELSVAEGTTVLVSRWRAAAPMLLCHVGYHESVFASLGSRRPVAGWDGVNSPNAGLPASASIWKQIGQLFATHVPDGEEHRYAVSVAIAERMMTDPFAGVLYPSMSMWANADNVALRPSWVDANLRFVGVESVRVKVITGTTMEVEVLDYATSPDGETLAWKGRGLNWVMRESGGVLRFESTGEIWRAFDDQTGRELDPE